MSFWIQESALKEIRSIFQALIWSHFGCEAQALTDLIISNHAITLIFGLKINNKLHEATTVQPSTDRNTSLTDHHNIQHTLRTY